MTLWRGKHPPILASQSHARRALLASAGINFEAVPAEIDERAVEQASGLSSPGDIALLLAREKALSVSSHQPDRFVIGADQTLALGQRLFGKPANRAQAAEQLCVLAGHSHELHSAVAVARDLVIATDHDFLVHCFDANTGHRYWFHELEGVSWGTPLIR